jgi:hypothetical protein
VSYPPARTATRQARPTQDPNHVRQGVVSIDLDALAGRADLRVGNRVLIGGNGAHAGEVAVIERLVNGVIPSAHIRTESGHQRQARTIDLTPVGPASPAGNGPVPESAPGEDSPGSP